jgi:hypothetical protein
MKFLWRHIFPVRLFATLGLSCPMGEIYQGSSQFVSQLHPVQVTPQYLPHIVPVPLKDLACYVFI